MPVLAVSLPSTSPPDRRRLFETDDVDEFSDRKPVAGENAESQPSFPIIMRSKESVAQNHQQQQRVHSDQDDDQGGEVRQFRQALRTHPRPEPLPSHSQSNSFESNHDSDGGGTSLPPQCRPRPKPALTSPRNFVLHYPSPSGPSSVLGPAPGSDPSMAASPETLPTPPSSRRSTDSNLFGPGHALLRNSLGSGSSISGGDSYSKLRLTPTIFPALIEPDVVQENNLNNKHFMMHNPNSLPTSTAKNAKDVTDDSVDRFLDSNSPEENEDDEPTAIPPKPQRKRGRPAGSGTKSNTGAGGFKKTVVSMAEEEMRGVDEPERPDYVSIAVAEEDMIGEDKASDSALMDLPSNGDSLHGMDEIKTEEQIDQDGTSPKKCGSSHQRPLKNTKRAAQNREAQRAFRERKERYVKELEKRSIEYDQVLQEREGLKLRIRELELSGVDEKVKDGWELERQDWESRAASWERERGMLRGEVEALKRERDGYRRRLGLPAETGSLIPLSAYSAIAARNGVTTQQDRDEDNSVICGVKRRRTSLETEGPSSTGPTEPKDYGRPYLPSLQNLLTSPSPSSSIKSSRFSSSTREVTTTSHEEISSSFYQRRVPTPVGVITGRPRKPNSPSPPPSLSSSSNSPALSSSHRHRIIPDSRTRFENFNPHQASPPPPPATSFLMHVNHRSGGMSSSS